MSYSIPDLATIVPEIFLLVMASIILLIDASIKPEKRDVTYWLSQLTLVIGLLLTLDHHGSAVRLSFNDMVVNDGMSDMLKSAIFVIMFFVFMYSRSYLKDHDIYRGEFFILALFATLGMLIMVSSNHLLVLFLGLEMLALASYALASINRDSAESSEAAMKYFVLGALATGLLLYGMSLIYGITGSLYIPEIANALIAVNDQHVVLLVGLAFMVVGIGFKLGVVPFHMWVPDVYQGAPTPVTLFIGSAPKIAAFAMLIRLLAEAMGPMQADWQNMLMIMAVLSMIIGNVVAIAQTNFKRMLAYSTISHMGFIIMGVLAGTVEGYSGAMFYAVSYAFMSAAGFGFIIFLSRKGYDANELADLKGLNDRSPWFAFMMLIIMFSMAGIPFTLGFWAKLAVIKPILQIDMVWLAIVAVVLSVVGSFYYLRALKMVYFDKPEGQASGELEVRGDVRLAISVNGLAILALGLYPSVLITLCSPF